MRINWAGNPENPKRGNTAGRGRTRNPNKIQKSPRIPLRTAQPVRKMKRIPDPPIITGANEQRPIKLYSRHQKRSSKNRNMYPKSSHP